MRRILIASAIVAAGLALLPAATSAAPPLSTSDLLRSGSAVQTVQYPSCKRVCTGYGYCGDSYNRYKCCKYWKKVCH